MSTRSSISKVNADGTITSLYCHSDGYLSHNGKMLLSYYNNQEAVDALIALGDLSFIDQYVTPPAEVTHKFDDRCPGVTVAYGRDRGETGTDAQTHDTAGFIEHWRDAWIAYYYQWRDGKWYWGKDANSITNELTKEAIEKDE